ncbi:MAG: hypothetical protein WCF67_02955 [Chitinophagaceae bacterium]
MRNQIRFLSLRAKEHTAIGLFIYFAADQGIDQYKTDVGDIHHFEAGGNSIERIDGVEISNDNLNILADVTVYLKNGIIDSLEIWNKNGHDYPIKEPANYELRQVWLDKDSRRIITK